jgi:hypothetical protein
MSQSDRFFAWVWRVNALLLLGLGMAGFVGAVVLIFNIGISLSRERPDRQLTQVAGADLTARDLRLADFRTIAGTSFLYAPLAPPSEYIGSSSSGGLGFAHNLLFFDTSTKKAHWLLPDNDHTIQSFSFLMDPPGVRYAYDDGESHRPKQVAIAILVEIQDSPGTPSANRGSRRLAIASPDGRGLTPIAESIDGLLGYHQPSNESVLIFYVSGGAVRVLEVDPIARKLRSDGLVSTQE